MEQKRSPTAIKFFLGMVFLIGIGLNIFIVLDAEKFHWVFPDKTEKKIIGNMKEFYAKAQKSILLVVSTGCEKEPLCSGTGFIFKPGYVATNAHVITCSGNHTCKQIFLKDYKGRKYEAQLEGGKSGIGTVEDIAILRIEDMQLPALELGDSAIYEVEQGNKIVTLGYPLPGAASTIDKAALSAIGLISTFDSNKGLFICKGMDIELGNSGGPVFLVEEKKVLGLTVSTMRGDKIAGVEFVIPINELKNYYEQIIGTF